MEQRQEKVLFETEHLRIRGNVTLATDGYRSRLSDMLNAGERTFIPLTDAVVETLSDGGGGESKSYPFLALGREHVVYAVALD